MTTPWTGSPLPAGWIARSACKDPRGKHASLVAFASADDQEASRQGWNLLGPALDVSPLSASEQAELAYLHGQLRQEQGAEEFATEGELLARCGRFTVPGLDVDASDRAASEEIAQSLHRACLTRGWSMRAARSSGTGAGIHLEWAPSLTALPPEALRMALRLVAPVAREAGLVPWHSKKSSSSEHGVPLDWVRPCDEHSVAPPAKLDLRPLNHQPAGRARLFRPLGGLNKTRTARKALCDWSPVEITRLSPAILAAAPPPPARPPRTGGGAKATKTWEPTPNAGAPHAPHVTTWARKHRRPKEQHELRLAFMAVCQQRKLLDREAAVEAIGAGWEDFQDARLAWDSTEARLRQGGLVKGLGYMRKELGHGGMQRLAEAIALDTGLSPGEAIRRLGLPTARRHVDVRALIAAVESTELKARLARAERCGAYGHHRHCGACDEHLSHSRMRCDVGELCLRCAAVYHRRLIGWLLERWPKGHYAWSRKGGFTTREDAGREVKDMREGLHEGQRPIALIYPDRLDGEPRSWNVLAVAPENEKEAARAVRLMASVLYIGDKNSGEDTDSGSEDLESVCARIGHAILARTSVILDLAAEGDTYAAAALLQECYRGHTIRRCAGMVLPWPTRDAIRTWRPEGSEPPPDECPQGHPLEVAGVHHVYTVERTGEVVCESKWLMTMSAVMRDHDKAARNGQVESWSPEHASELAVPL